MTNFILVTFQTVNKKGTDQTVQMHAIVRFSRIQDHMGLILRKPEKPVLSGHSKIDKTENLMTNSCLMKVKSIAECSKSKVLQNAPIGAFCNTFDLHLAIIGFGN